MKNTLTQFRFPNSEILILQICDLKLKIPIATFFNKGQTDLSEYEIFNLTDKLLNDQQFILLNKSNFHKANIISTDLHSAFFIDENDYIYIC